MTSQEPPTSAKVVMTTTHGDLDIELWANECPKTCRNFISLCLEGYYDQTIFHRIMPKFMIQGGDPTGTGNGGQSIYGQPFENEIHMRLRFTHRGLLAMANLEQNQNTSQFFFTYDACPWLDKKNTIFGKIVGNTMFNLLAMEKLDTDADDRPIIPPKILSVKILEHPFKDIVVRQTSVVVEKKPQSIVKKTVLKKQTNLLSFQDDSENESGEEQQINNAHDVLQDKKLAKDSGEQAKRIEERQRKLKEQEEKESKIKKQVKMESKPVQMKEDDMLDKRLQRMPGQLMEGMKTRKNKKTGQIEIYYDHSQDSGQEDQQQVSYSSTDSEEYGNEETKQIRQKQKQEYENLKIEFLQFKKEKEGTSERQERGKYREEKKLLSNLELRQLKFFQNKRTKPKDTEMMSRLNAFKKKINSEKVTGDEDHWMNNSLKFHIDSARAFSHFQNQDKLSIQAQKNNKLLEQIQGKEKQAQEKPEQTND